VAELEESNAQLHVELAAAQSRLAEVERRGQALTSDYEGLKNDFGDLRSTHTNAVKQKADLKKMEHEKVQWFQNSLHRKLAELRRDMETIVAVLGGGAGIFPPLTPLPLAFWSGSRWRLRHCPVPSVSATKISLVMH
jgi:hypothetical protein